jgi:hypothetical protein
MLSCMSCAREGIVGGRLVVRCLVESSYGGINFCFCDMSL